MNKGINSLKNYTLLFTGLVILIFIFYGGIFNTWFQQDEWDWLGRYTYMNSVSKFPFGEAFKSSFFPHPRYRFTPFFDATFAAQVHFFGLNFAPYAIVSLVLHATNSFLVFALADKLTKNKSVAIISSLLFATTSIGQKAVTWIFTSINSQGAALFSFLSLITFFNYLDQPEKKKIVLPLAFLLIALWFKETAVSLFFLLPAITFIKNKKLFKKMITRVSFLAAVYFLSRFLLSHLGAKIHLEGYPDFGRFLTPTEYLQILFWTPLRTLVNVFIFPRTLIEIADRTIGFLVPDVQRAFIETKGVNLVTLAIASALMILLYKFYQKQNTKKAKQLIILSSLLIVSASVVHLLLSIRGTAALSPFIRSRDLYFAVSGASLLLALILAKIYEKRKIIFLIILGLYFFYHYLNITSVIDLETQKALMRKPVVNYIFNRYPNLPKKVIFFGASDTKFYGHSVATFPFQTGFGRTLLVWYTIKTNRPREFVKADFLYYPLEEGYREIGDWGFGYFRDLEKLEMTLKENSLSSDSVYAFSYFGAPNITKDITQEIRKELDEKVRRD